MTVSSIITIIQKIIDISLVWVIIYSVLKGLKNNIKMVLIFKGVIMILVIKLLSDWFNLTTVGLLLEYINMGNTCTYNNIPTGNKEHLRALRETTNFN